MGQTQGFLGPIERRFKAFFRAPAGQTRVRGSNCPGLHIRLPGAGHSGSRLFLRQTMDPENDQPQLKA
jgi:hypothetical protein